MEIKGKSIMFCGSGDTGTGMLAQHGVLRHLENVSVYSSAYDCLMEEGFMPGEITEMEKDFCDFLRCVDDWEPINYVVINSEIVIFCDSINGDVGGFCTISEFLEQMQEEYESKEYRI